MTTEVATRPKSNREVLRGHLQVRLPPFRRFHGHLQTATCDVSNHTKRLFLSRLANRFPRNINVRNRNKNLRLTIPALIACQLLTPAALAEELDFHEAEVKAECSAKWGTKYEMVAYCIDRRKEGFDNFSYVRNHTGPNFGETLDHCAEKWGIKWDMVSYCTEKQLDALNKLASTVASVPEQIGIEIQVACDEKWRPDWPMVVYCMERQVAGWHSIND